MTTLSKKPINSESFVEKTWTDFAACKGQTDIFFPTGMKNLTADYVRFLVNEYCSKCLIVLNCRELGLEGSDAAYAIHGVWGGVWKRNKRRILSQRQYDTPEIKEARRRDLLNELGNLPGDFGRSYQ